MKFQTFIILVFTLILMSMTAGAATTATYKKTISICFNYF